MKPYEVIESDKTYNGKIIDVKVDKITLPNGKTALREVVLHGGAAAMIPVDDDGNIVFVRQYRHPTGGEVLEIPAGTLEKGEDPRDCALREIEEEIGFKAGKLTFITAIYSAIGFCTERIHIYLAENLILGEQNFDPDEFITIEKYSLEKSIEMIFSGEISDSKTIIAILAYKEMKSKS